jgi:uncharacterized protein YjiS (DUF1127 family)
MRQAQADGRWPGMSTGEFSERAMVSEHLHPMDVGSQPIVSAGLSRLQSGWARFSASWVARRRWRREMRQPQAFSDRELKDVRLSRSDLHAIARIRGEAAIAYTRADRRTRDPRALSGGADE